MWSLLAQRGKAGIGEWQGESGRQKGQMVIRNHKARHDGSSRTAEEQGNFCSKRERNKGRGRQPPNRRTSQASHQAGRQAKARQGSQAVGKPLSLAVSDTHTRCPKLVPVAGAGFEFLDVGVGASFRFWVFGFRAAAINYHRQSHSFHFERNARATLQAALELQWELRGELRGELRLRLRLRLGFSA